MIYVGGKMENEGRRRRYNRRRSAWRAGAQAVRADNLRQGSVCAAAARTAGSGKNKQRECPQQACVAGEGPARAAVYKPTRVAQAGQRAVCASGVVRYA